jgi:hypothetical protein
MNMATTGWSISTCQQGDNDILNKDYERRWIGKGGPAAWPYNLNPYNFILWGCMRSRMYFSGKPETRHQSVEAIDEDNIGI